MLFFVKKHIPTLLMVVALNTNQVHADAGSAIKDMLLAFIEFPQLVVKTTMTLMKIGKTIIDSRQIISSPNTANELLKRIDNELDSEINQLQNELNSVRENKIVETINFLNIECSGPFVAFMGVPDVGQGVSAMCSKITAAGLKIESLLSRGDLILSRILDAKQRVRKKLKKIKKIR